MKKKICERAGKIVDPEKQRGRMALYKVAE